ncbi:MAG: diguanylate cyclase [Alphaproteobacteria bacterium]|nr:diguanylate cyclase [Alphaproteobacteria bacterium]
MIESNVEEAESLTSQLRQFGYCVTHCATAEASIAAVSTVNPVALLVGLSAGDTAIGEIEEIGATAKQHDTYPPVIFLSPDAQITTRLAAVRAGATALLLKPASMLDLVDTLDPLTDETADEPFRVLIVDDDPRICKYYQMILSEAGMQSKVCNKPLEAFEVLSEFRPELIIMDLYMPECRGKELAAVIRQEPAFDSIPIVFLSAEDDLLKQLDVMTIGGDDFLTKPIRPEHLVMAVYTRARRFRSLRSLMLRDSLTGLLNHTTTKEHVDIELARMRREGQPLAFATIDLDHFKQVNDTYGHPAGDRVIKTLSSLLKQRLRNTDVIGRTGGEEFAVALTGVGAEQAVEIMNDVRESFSRIRQQHSEGEFVVTLSCGIAIFPDFCDLASLTDAADRALYQAKHAGRNQAVLADA